MIRSLLVLAFIAFVIWYVLTITQSIFAPGALISLTIGLILIAISAWSPTQKPLEPVSPPKAPGETPPCPVCRNPLRWIGEFDRWWCEAERKFR